MTGSIDTFERVVVALLIGLLIGLDRERAELRKEHRLFAGVRTFPLIALAGAVPALLIPTLGISVLLISFIVVSAVSLISYVRSTARGDLGATTEMAALSTFLLGVLAGMGELLLAGAAGVAVAVLLVAKPRLEGFSRALTGEEFTAALELAVITVIVLPLLPNQGYGPWQALNPFAIWLIVVLVSALSFAGFIAMRVWGERQGILIAALLGSLVSSTAVTMAMAARSKADSSLAGITSAAAVLASSVMCARVAVLVGSISLGILAPLLPVVAGMAVTGLIAAWLLRGKASERRAADAQLANPFSLRAAVTFAIVYTAILLLVRLARMAMGDRGLYLAAALSAVADVDAISIAVTRLGAADAAWRTAAVAVTIAVVTNTLVKLGIAATLGAAKFRLYVAGALGAMAAVGAAAGAITSAFWTSLR
jgi:uncharacterized membrane protein (DUF4010 family)